MIRRDSSPFWWLLEFWMAGYYVQGDHQVLMKETYPEQMIHDD